jgi:hypothetical protein
VVPTRLDDLVLANKYTDDQDVVTGGGGFDRINGGKGRDFCIVDARKEAGESCAKVQVQRR